MLTTTLIPTLSGRYASRMSGRSKVCASTPSQQGLIGAHERRRLTGSSSRFLSGELEDAQELLFSQATTTADYSASYLQQSKGRALSAEVQKLNALAGCGVRAVRSRAMLRAHDRVRRRCCHGPPAFKSLRLTDTGQGDAAPLRIAQVFRSDTVLIRFPALWC